MKKLSLLVFCFTLLSCVTYVGGYRFSMLKPSDNHNMAFSDSNIDITFEMSQTYLMGVEGMEQYKNYDGIAFTLTNKTNEVMVIDWNKISFKDPSGSSGNAVMHRGVKYKDCVSPKTPSTIPPKGKIADIIIPCYGVEFNEIGWKVEMLPSPRKHPKVTFGIFMPVQIGEQVINYKFEFQAISDQQK